MKRLFAFAIAATSCVSGPKVTEQYFKGVQIKECLHGELGGAVLPAEGSDLSVDLATDKALKAFSERYSPPERLIPYLRPELITACAQGSVFKVMVGVNFDHLKEIKERIDQIAHSNDSRNWHRLASARVLAGRLSEVRTFLSRLNVTSSPVVDVSTLKALQNEAATVTYQFIPDEDIDPILLSVTKTSFMDLGFKPTDGKTKPIVSARINLVKEELPKTGSMNFVRLTAIISVVSENFQMERSIKAKGGGLSSEQAFRAARDEIAKRLGEEIILSFAEERL